MDKIQESSYLKLNEISWNLMLSYIYMFHIKKFRAR
jgi:hypothetical protein